MANTLILDQPFVFCGLGTLTYTATSTGAGVYNVHVELSETPPSGLSIVVNQNGTPKYTAPTITPTQGALQFHTQLLLANSDVVTVVLSSSTAIDSLLNTIKSTVTVGQGQ